MPHNASSASHLGRNSQFPSPQQSHGKWTSNLNPNPADSTPPMHLSQPSSSMFPPPSPSMSIFGRRRRVSSTFGGLSGPFARQGSASSLPSSPTITIFDTAVTSTIYEASEEHEGFTPGPGLVPLSPIQARHYRHDPSSTSRLHHPLCASPATPCTCAPASPRFCPRKNTTFGLDRLMSRRTSASSILTNGSRKPAYSSTELTIPRLDGDALVEHGSPSPSFAGASSTPPLTPASPSPWSRTRQNRTTFGFDDSFSFPDISTLPPSPTFPRSQPGYGPGTPPPHLPLSSSVPPPRLTMIPKAPASPDLVFTPYSHRSHHPPHNHHNHHHHHHQYEPYMSSGLGRRCSRSSTRSSRSLRRRSSTIGGRHLNRRRSSSTRLHPGSTAACEDKPTLSSIPLNLTEEASTGSMAKSWLTNMFAFFPSSSTSSSSIMPSSNRRSMMPTPPNGIKDNKGTSKSRRHKNGGDSASSSRPMSPASDMTVLHDDLFLFSPMSDPSSSTTPTSNTLSMTSSTSTKGPGSSSAASTMTSLSSASFEYNLKKIRKLSIFNGSKPSRSPLPPSLLAPPAPSALPQQRTTTPEPLLAPLPLPLLSVDVRNLIAQPILPNPSRAVTPSLQEPVSTPCPIPEIEIQMDTTVESLVEEISAMLSQRPCSRMSGRSSVGSARPEGSMNPSRSPTPVIYGRAGDKEEILEDDDPPTNKLEGPGPPPALMSVPMIPRPPRRSSCQHYRLQQQHLQQQLELQSFPAGQRPLSPSSIGSGTGSVGGGATVGKASGLSTMMKPSHVMIPTNAPTLSSSASMSTLSNSPTVSDVSTSSSVSTCSTWSLSVPKENTSGMDKKKGYFAAIFRRGPKEEQSRKKKGSVKA